MKRKKIGNLGVFLLSMGKIIFSISLSKELFNKLENQRGLISRSTYVEFLLTKLIKEQEDGARRGTDISKQKD